LKLWRYGGEIEWLDGRSQDLLPTVRRQVDMVHIDGDHSAEIALQDLLRGWRLTNRLMVVHDLQFTTVHEAFHRFSAKTGMGLNRWYTGDTGTGVVIR